MQVLMRRGSAAEWGCLSGEGEQAGTLRDTGWPPYRRRSKAENASSRMAARREFR